MNVQKKQKAPIEIDPKIKPIIIKVFNTLTECSLMDQGHGGFSEYYSYEDALEMIAPRSRQQVVATLMMGQDLNDGIIDDITAIKLTLQEDPALILLIQPQNSEGNFEIHLVSSHYFEDGVIEHIDQPNVIMEIFGLDPESEKNKHLSTGHATVLQQFSKFLFDNLKHEF